MQRLDGLLMTAVQYHWSKHIDRMMLVDSYAKQAAALEAVHTSSEGDWSEGQVLIRFRVSSSYETGSRPYRTVPDSCCCKVPNCNDMLNRVAGWWR